MVDGTQAPRAMQLFPTARLPACCSPSPHQPLYAASAPSLEQANLLASIKQEDEKLRRWEIRGMWGGGGGNLGIDLPASSSALAFRFVACLGHVPSSGGFAPARPLGRFRSRALGKSRQAASFPNG